MFLGIYSFSNFLIYCYAFYSPLTPFIFVASVVIHILDFLFYLFESSPFLANNLSILWLYKK